MDKRRLKFSFLTALGVVGFLTLFIGGAVLSVFTMMTYLIPGIFLFIGWLISVFTIMIYLDD